MVFCLSQFVSNDWVSEAEIRYLRDSRTIKRDKNTIAKLEELFPLAKPTRRFSFINKTQRRNPMGPFVTGYECTFYHLFDPKTFNGLMLRICPDPLHWRDDCKYPLPPGAIPTNMLDLRIRILHSLHKLIFVAKRYANPEGFIGPMTEELAYLYQIVRLLQTTLRFYPDSVHANCPGPLEFEQTLQYLDDNFNSLIDNPLYEVFSIKLTSCGPISISTRRATFRPLLRCRALQEYRDVPVSSYIVPFPFPQDFTSEFAKQLIDREAIEAKKRNRYFVPKIKDAHAPIEKDLYYGCNYEDLSLRWK